MPDVPIRRPNPLADPSLEGYVRLLPGESPQEALDRVRGPRPARRNPGVVSGPPPRHDPCDLVDCYWPATEERTYHDVTLRVCVDDAAGIDAAIAEEAEEAEREREREADYLRWSGGTALTGKRTHPVPERLHGYRHTEGRPDRPSKRPENRRAEYDRANAKRRAAKAG